MQSRAWASPAVNVGSKYQHPNILIGFVSLKCSNVTRMFLNFSDNRLKKDPSPRLGLLGPRQIVGLKSKFLKTAQISQ